jgi:hypothetical protein
MSAPAVSPLTGLLLLFAATTRSQSNDGETPVLLSPAPATSDFEERFEPELPTFMRPEDNAIRRQANEVACVLDGGWPVRPYADIADRSSRGRNRDVRTAVAKQHACVSSGQDISIDGQRVAPKANDTGRNIFADAAVHREDKGIYHWQLDLSGAAVRDDDCGNNILRCLSGEQPEVNVMLLADTRSTQLVACPTRQLGSERAVARQAASAATNASGVPPASAIDRDGQRGRGSRPHQLDVRRMRHLSGDLHLRGRARTTA